MEGGHQAAEFSSPALPSGPPPPVYPKSTGSGALGDLEVCFPRRSLGKLIPAISWWGRGRPEAQRSGGGKEWAEKRFGCGVVPWARSCEALCSGDTFCIQKQGTRRETAGLQRPLGAGGGGNGKRGVPGTPQRGCRRLGCAARGRGGPTSPGLALAPTFPDHRRPRASSVLHSPGVSPYFPDCVQNPGTTAPGGG